MGIFFPNRARWPYIIWMCAWVSVCVVCSFGFCCFTGELSVFVIVLLLFLSLSSTQSRNDFWYEKARKGDTFNHRQAPTHTLTHIHNKHINRKRFEVKQTSPSTFVSFLRRHFALFFVSSFVSIFCPSFVRYLLIACIHSICLSHSFRTVIESEFSTRKVESLVTTK